MKKLLLAVLITVMFAPNVYAKKNKGSVSKAPAKSQPAVAAPQKQTSTQNQSAPAPAQAQAANPNPSQPAAAPNAVAQSPSLMQSVMPALVGGAVGSYVGNKLAGDGGEHAKVAEENAEKKEEQFLK
jgi:hypothetical protein